MLEKQDLEVLRLLIREELEPVHEELRGMRGEIDAMRAEIDTMHGEIDSLRKEIDTMRAEFNARIEKVEILLLDEIARTQTYLEKQIADVRKQVEKLTQYYQITRLETENSATILKLVADIQTRLAELEQKIVYV